MKEIKLTQGFVTMVDDEDYPYLSQFRWRVNQRKHRHTCYAVRRISVNGKREEIWMHRELMNTPDHLQVDHRDHNGLNNQKSNLRNCTRNDNCRNIPSRRGSSSKYLGVTVRTYKRVDGGVNYYYTADLKCNGTQHRLGNHKSEEAAARAYNEKAVELFGEFANLNDI